MKKGVITVYLAITFSVLLSLFLSVFEAARAGAYRIAVECALRGAILSAFAEYNRELLDQYDLLFIDLTYQSNRYSFDALSERVEKRMGENLNLPKERVSGAVADLFGKSTVQTEIKEARMATDSFGAVMRNQAVEYMKEVVSEDFITDLQSLKELRNTYSLTEEMFEKEKEQAKKNGSFLEEDKADTFVSAEEEKDVEVLVNPDVEYYFLQPLEVLVMKGDVFNVSGKTFNPLDVPSSRIGSCPGEGEEDKNQIPDPLSDLYFAEYCMQKSGNYTNPKEEGFLRYETEYLIAGTPSDSANLSAVIHLIFAVRTMANVVSLKKDSEKMAEIEVLSLGLSLITRGDPETIANTILFLWAGAESTYDLEDLLKGKKVELIKEASSFHTSLAEGVYGLPGAGASFSDMAIVDSFAEETGIGEYSSCGKTMESSIKLSYEDYLRLFLVSLQPPLLTMRMMDVMELDIRMTQGNEFFRMDQCLESAAFAATVESSFGVKYFIRRCYGYE